MQLLESLGEMSYDKAIEVLKRYKQSLRTLKTREVAIVILENGDVYRIPGTPEGVNISGLKGQLKNAFVTHNHLPEPTSFTFSFDDFGGFEKYGIHTLRGADIRYAYELTRGFEAVPSKLSFDLSHYDVGLKAYEVGIAYRRWKID